MEKQQIATCFVAHVAAGVRENGLLNTACVTENQPYPPSFWTLLVFFLVCAKRNCP